MQKQNILFNLDDTLVYCNRYFLHIIETFTCQMKKWFHSITKEDIRKKQQEVDLKAIDHYGLKSERFPESFVDTYTYFCELTGREEQESEKDSLRELGFNVFKIPVEPIPDMYETLQQLKDEGHALYLHTGGDEPNQHRKITQLELAAFFENRIFISEYKDSTALSDILKTIHAEPNRTWMVGNSLKTDIKPALEMNINAIYIPAETEWKYDFVDLKIKPNQAFFRLESLIEVPETIHKQILMKEKVNMDIPSHIPSYLPNDDWDLCRYDN